MVYRKKTSHSKKRKRSYKSKRTLSTTTNTLPLGKYFKSHNRYVEGFIDLNPGALGSNAPYTFSANGLYDPNITGSGHQPIGFD